MSHTSGYQRHPYLARLENWRAPIFNFSLLCSLGIVTYAFNWTSYHNSTAQQMEVTEIPAEPVIEMNIPFIIVEDMPRFNGCEDITENKAERAICSSNKLFGYIYKNIRYPAVARENRIEGTVVIQFTVEKDGSITDINILKEIGGGCGAEAVRVVQGMPDWIPGKQRGKTVRVRYSLPVKYTLN